ncbi:FtsX-like permease family protein [soil metagenome]
MRSLVLGLQLLRRSGRAGLIRACSLAAGVALAVVAVLALLSIPSVVDAQAERYARLLPQFADTSAQLDTAPLRATYSEEGIDGRELRVLTVGATGTSPVDVPTWLPQLPEPGEVIVSPALRVLIEDDNRVLLDRFPQTVVAEIGQEALVAPDELAAAVGAPADDFDQRVAYVGFGRPLDERGDVDPRAVRLVVAVVVLFVLAPLVVLIATASRLSARTTERRLAALRVLGLSAKRTRRVLAAETSVVATIGALVGAAVWAIARPFSQRVGIGSLNWWADDISVPPPIIGIVITVVVALAAVIALLGANPTVESPGQGRANRAAPPTRRWRPVVLATGLVLLASSYIVTSSLPDNTWFAIFALGNLLTALGLAFSVPTFARLAAGILDRKRGSTAATLASRRLRYEPTAVGRVIAAMLIVVFAGGFAQALLAAFDHAYAGDGETNERAADAPIVLSLNRVADPDISALDQSEGTVAVVETISSTDENADALILLANCDTMVMLSPATDPATCDNRVPQPLVSSFLPEASPLRPTPALADALAAVGYTGDIGGPLASEIFTGVGRDGSTIGGDIRLAPELATLRSGPSVSNVSIVIDPDSEPTRVAARIAGLEPTGELSGLDDIGRLRFADSYRTLVNAAMIFTLVISLGAAALAATDRAIERRRTAAHLAALGVPAKTQRKAEVLTTMTPLALGLIAAVVGAGLSGSSYLEWGEPGLRLPLASSAIILLTGLGCAAVAAGIAAAATSTRPTPDRLRTE